MPISRLDPGALPLIQPLFRQVFGHDISLSFLEWKYGAEHGESWYVGDDEGKPLLHCGVFYRDILLAGQQHRIGQLTDLMAAPKQAGLTRKDSPFTRLMQRILEELPSPRNPHGLAVGFPSDRAMRLGEHLGVYKAIDDWHELVFTARPRRRFSPGAGDATTLGDALPALTDTLWGRMRDDLGEHPVGIRDYAYLERRYLHHPQHRHHCLLVRSFWRRRPLALAILRGESEHLELLDLIGPLSAMPAALAAVQAWLPTVGGRSFAFWLTSRFAKQFAALAERSRVTEFRIMANPRTPAAILEQFDHRWWLTGGDTDYR